MHTTHLRRLAWIAIILGGLAMLMALWRPAFTMRGPGYERPAEQAAPPHIAPGVPEDAAPRGAAPRWHAKRFHDAPPWHRPAPWHGPAPWHRAGYGPHASGLKSLLLGAGLIGLGLWLVWRSKRDEPRDPPLEPGQASMV